MSICLYGVFRDEAKHLPLMLEESEPFTDAYAFIEGGPSSDKTARIMKDWLKTHDGQLVQYKRWPGIERAQNAALKLGRQTGADYLYTSGGGEIVRQVAPLPELVEDVYMLEYSGDMRWWMPRLVSSKLDCRWREPTHSYLDVSSASQGAFLHALKCEDTAYEDRREGKLKRDRRILERRLRKYPDSSRALFYLAQTYRCLGLHEKAVELYVRRSNITEHEEERWYSHLMAGALTANTHELLMAWAARPWRAEPLRTLAQLYRGSGVDLLADLFDLQADAIPYPKGEIFFVHADDYKVREAA